jgi:hypothetical protein
MSTQTTLDSAPTHSAAKEPGTTRHAYHALQGSRLRLRLSRPRHGRHTRALNSLTPNCCFRAHPPTRARANAKAAAVASDRRRSRPHSAPKRGLQQPAKGSMTICFVDICQISTLVVKLTGWWSWLPHPPDTRKAPSSSLGSVTLFLPSSPVDRAHASALSSLSPSLACKMCSGMKSRERMSCTRSRPRHAHLTAALCCAAAAPGGQQSPEPDAQQR